MHGLFGKAKFKDQASKQTTVKWSIEQNERYIVV